MQFEVKNTTPDEDMREGTFIIVYNYNIKKLVNGQEVTENITGTSESIPSGTLVSGTPSPGPLLAYYNNPIPVNATDVKHMLVFRGALGFEYGAVVGKIMNVQKAVWEEHWNNGLKGNHDWLFTGIDTTVDNTKGSVANAIVDGVLEKTNVRRIGNSDNHYNLTTLELPTPIEVSENANILLNLYEMSINPTLPLQTDCSKNLSELPAAQKVEFRFRLGDGTVTSFHYTMAGHQDFGPAATVNPGQPTMDNIFDFISYANNGRPIVKPVRLESIYINQKLYGLCTEVASDQTQTMSVDYIRILDDPKPAIP